jgi:membrane protease YdiL (CAAX protease family)
LNAERYALLWILVFGCHPISELGLTSRRWPLSLGLQAVLAVLLYIAAYRGDVVDPPPATQLMPLVALALATEFFEAVFWRGWVLLRLAESIGIVPAIVLGRLLLMRPTISAT